MITPGHSEREDAILAVGVTQRILSLDQVERRAFTKMVLEGESPSPTIAKKLEQLSLLKGDQPNPMARMLIEALSERGPNSLDRFYMMGNSLVQGTKRSLEVLKQKTNKQTFQYGESPTEKGQPCIAWPPFSKKENIKVICLWQSKQHII